jgi:PKD repeat protein/beta-lactamase class A
VPATAAQASPRLDEGARAASVVTGTVPAGATAGVPGVYVREYRSAEPISDAPILDVAGSRPIEPASQIKIAFAAALERRAEAAGRTIATGGDLTSWRYPTTRSSANPPEYPDKATNKDLCPNPQDETPSVGDPPRFVNGSATSYDVAVSRMMTISDNIQTRAVLLEIARGGGDSRVAAGSRDALGAPGLGDVLRLAGAGDTVLKQDLPGCGFTDGDTTARDPRRGLRNTTTLADLARIWTGIDTSRLVSSPLEILNRSPRGRWDAQTLAVVDDEIAALQVPDDVARAFKNDLYVWYKGGSYLNGCTGDAQTQSPACAPGESRYSTDVGVSGIQQVPFLRADRTVDLRRYAVGVSLTDRFCPTERTDPNLTCYSDSSTSAFAGRAAAVRPIVRDALLSYLHPGDAVPTATFDAPAALTGSAAAFDGRSSRDDQGIAAYQWDFGDDSAIATGANPSHTYAAAGTYAVRLRVVDSVGKSSTVTRNVTVGTPPSPAPDPVPGPGSPTLTPVPPAAPGASAPSPSAPAPSAPADRSAPSISIGGALRLVKGRSASLRLKLGENATVRILVTRQERGRRSGKRCVAETPKLRKAKRCTRTVTIASSTVSGRSGTSSVAIPRGSKLAVGRYTVSVTATDAAGNASKTAGVKLTVVRRKR